MFFYIMIVLLSYLRNKNILNDNVKIQNKNFVYCFLKIFCIDFINKKGKELK